MANLLAEAALEKKAQDVVILDLRKLDAMADYFVICTGDVDQHSRSIAHHLEKQAKELKGERVYSREGMDKLNWVLLDYIDVIVHIFKPNTREFYRLEDLWSDAEATPVVDKPKRVKKTEAAPSETTAKVSVRKKTTTVKKTEADKSETVAKESVRKKSAPVKKTSTKKATEIEKPKRVTTTTKKDSETATKKTVKPAATKPRVKRKPTA